MRICNNYIIIIIYYSLLHVFGAVMVTHVLQNYYNHCDPHTQVSLFLCLIQTLCTYNIIKSRLVTDLATQQKNLGLQ